MAWYVLRVIGRNLVQIVAECPSEKAAGETIDRVKEVVDMEKIQHHYRVWEDSRGASPDSIKRAVMLSSN
ncbi:hypothetical protein LCGC14_1931890 [marine sediment metagenome]|uniref:Uncharacterized protein n=1 Tax=marine sediment metagenome TaxID=412755 RepID=A0A0F9FMR6_9ZZZZ